MIRYVYNMVDIDYTAWVGYPSNHMPQVHLGDSFHEPVGWIKTATQINEMHMARQVPNDSSGEGMLDTILCRV